MPDEELPILFSYGGVDGGPRVEVVVSEDSMLAWGTFFHATESQGKLLVWTEFLTSLQTVGLGSCLLERDIQEALFRFNTGHPSPEKIVIAKGRAPQAERPAYLKLEPRFYNHHLSGSRRGSGGLQGILAFRHCEERRADCQGNSAAPWNPGHDGLRLGNSRREKRHQTLETRASYLVCHGKVFSRIAGRFTLEGDVFDVSDSLELDGGVGYGTGNLFFPGSVVVKGVVSDGFKLVAGAGITVKGPLDASEVMCHGDLVCEGGVIGKKPGLVRVGGTVKALFVEHCQVEALGTITISKALLHTTVKTNGDLNLEEGGRIVASNVWVRGNLHCGQLGGENGPVKVVSGSDFVVHRKMEALRVKYQLLEQEIQKEKGHGQEPSPEQSMALLGIVQEMNSLTPLLFSNPLAEIRVSAKVYEGTVIEIGFASFTVVKEAKGQIYRLAPDGKSILSTPLSKDTKDSAPVAQ